MRDNLKDKAFLDKLIGEKSESIEKFSRLPVEKPDADFPSKMRWAYRCNTDHQERLCAMYTRGDKLAEIEPYYIEFLDDFADFLKTAINDIEYVRSQYSYTLDKFYRIASWAVLFKVDIEERKDFVERLDFFGAQKACDVMFDRAGLLNREINQRVGGRPAYETLLEALENSNPEQQVVLLNRFLKGWYPALKKMNVAWIDNHKAQFDVYFGYWCFEAAAAVKVLNLDPDRFKDAQYFPRDMIY